MSALVHSFLLALAILAVYVWLQIPALSHYSLQAFAATLIIYFILKRLSKAKLWHVAPSVLSIEMPLVTFAILLLIGSTGNFNSAFYPLTYIHLFFLVFATSLGGSISITALIVLFHYSLAPDLTPHGLSNLITLPLIMLFFLFTKDQYQQAKDGKQLLETEVQALSQTQAVESVLETFVTTSLFPKLEQLQKLVAYPQQNQQAIKGQLTWLQLEIHKLLNQLSNVRSSATTPPLTTTNATDNPTTTET